MTDNYSELVKRLREIGTNLVLEDDYQIAYKSADAIEALQARVAELELAIKRQAAATLTLHHAGAAIASNRLEQARKLAAESKPEMIESERTANALLTEENAALSAQVEQLTRERDNARLVTNAYIEGNSAAKARIAELEAALRGLHDDVVDYQTLNHLGGYDNHWLVQARAALGDELR